MTERFRTVSFFEKSPNMDIHGYSLDSNNILYVLSISLYICIYYVTHSSCTMCLYTTVCSGVCSVFVLMHAAELLQLFMLRQNQLPAEPGMWHWATAQDTLLKVSVFVHFVGLWQVH